MLGPDPVVAQPASLVDGEVDDRDGVGVAAVEHYRPPLLRLRRTWCFLWTDWRVIPRVSAIACQGHPSPGVVDVELLQLLDEIAQGGDRGQTDSGVPAVDGLVEAGELAHHSVRLG
jgi:hypothetical protein